MLRRRCQKASADKKRMNKKTASYRLRDGKNLPAVPLLLGPREKRQRGTLPRFPYDNGGTPARLKDGKSPVFWPATQGRVSVLGFHRLAPTGDSLMYRKRQAYCSPSSSVICSIMLLQSDSFVNIRGRSRRFLAVLVVPVEPTGRSHAEKKDQPRNGRDAKPHGDEDFHDLPPRKTKGR